MEREETCSTLKVWEDVYRYIDRRARKLRGTREHDDFIDFMRDAAVRAFEVHKPDVSRQTAASPEEALFGWVHHNLILSERMFYGRKASWYSRWGYNNYSEFRMERLTEPYLIPEEKILSQEMIRVALSGEKEEDLIRDIFYHERLISEIGDERGVGHTSVRWARDKALGRMRERLEV
jgi:hypothetical protein